MFIMIVYCKMSGLLINENMDDLYLRIIYVN